MREIKFRAWDRYEEKLWSWEQLLQQNYAIRYFFFVPDYLELTQYTGLKDKNGKEIYEGDIVLMSYGGLQGKPFAVEIPDIYADDLLPECSLEVIGNIYENKELLNDN